MVSQGYLKNPRIIEAFLKIKRRDFLSKEFIDNESANVPLPIGHGQTNSQPLTVAFMLELLAPEEGQKILDIGSGSGWTTALLAEIVGPRGQVYAIERISALKEFGESNVKKYKFNNVDFFCQDGTKGLKQFAPFDRIMVAAAATEIPDDLRQQLKVSGRLVIPTVAQDIKLIKKIKANKYEELSYPGFMFVPLIAEK